jgi:hypothetical protein
MKKLFFIIISTTFCLTSSAQTNGWNELGVGSDSIFGNKGVGQICTDKLGNVFVNNGNSVAKWNGVLWTQLGTGANALNPNNSIWSICTDDSGNVYAAGTFTDSVSFSKGHTYIAKWNGTTWAELGTDTNALNANGAIHSICADATGNLYAAGYFTNANGYYYVAKWNGTTWAELGTDTNALNANDVFFSIVTDSSGNVYAVGNFTNSSNREYVAKWNGTTWTELGTGTNALNANERIFGLCKSTAGNIYAAGYFTNSSGKYYVAKWNGTTWTELGTGTNALNANSYIWTICIDAYENIYAIGMFTNANGKFYVAKYNGTNWIDFGNNVTVINSSTSVSFVYTDALGNVYAANNFTGTSAKCYVAKWANPTPAINASNIHFTNIDSAWFSVGFIKGNGKKRLVICGLAPLTSLPIDSIIYFASSVFKSGYQLDSNNWVVYNDTGAFVTISGLGICTKYYISVIEYNYDSTHICYLRNKYLQGIDSTQFHHTLKINSSTGDSTYCSYTNFYLKGNNYSDVNYQWYKNGTSISGANNYTDSNITTGIYSLKISKNNCSLNSNNLTVTINQKPKSGFTINTLSQCLNENSFSFNDTTYSTITRLWNLGDFTTNTNDTFSKTYSNAGTYNVKLKVTDAHNCTDSSIKIVTVKASPTKPNITAITKSLLQSTVANTYQWYLNNTSITSATNQTLIITSNGSYTVKIDSTNGCSNLSIPFAASTVGIAAINNYDNEINIYPNPTTFELNIQTTSNEKLTAQMFDITGKQVIDNVFFNFSANINTSSLYEGMYFVRITNADGAVVKSQKIVVVR